jgi:hypothetical protein
METDQEAAVDKTTRIDRVSNLSLLEIASSKNTCLLGPKRRNLSNFSEDFNPKNARAAAIDFGTAYLVMLHGFGIPVMLASF